MAPVLCFILTVVGFCFLFKDRNRAGRVPLFFQVLSLMLQGVALLAACLSLDSAVVTALCRAGLLGMVPVCWVCYRRRRSLSSDLWVCWLSGVALLYGFLGPLLADILLSGVRIGPW